MLSYISFILFLLQVHGLESNYYQACWDVELNDENMFCYGAVNWKINEETYYNQE